MRSTKTLALALLLGLLCLAQQAQAGAILPVTGDYTVTEQVRSRERLGIRLRTAHNGNQTQNWLWLRPSTRVSMRHYNADGSYWDETLSYEKAWQVLTPGRKFRVHAARDWDGTLVAHQIWL